MFPFDDVIMVNNDRRRFSHIDSVPDALSLCPTDEITIDYAIMGLVRYQLYSLSSSRRAIKNEFNDTTLGSSWIINDYVQLPIYSVFPSVVPA